MLPSRDDLVEHRVVVTTLSTSRVLLDLQVLHGFFTHILIDEAAQALEPEALTPLIFAGPNTKVVFTGDHMQVKSNSAYFGTSFPNYREHQKSVVAVYSYWLIVMGLCSKLFYATLLFHSHVTDNST